MKTFSHLLLAVALGATIRPSPGAEMMLVPAAVSVAPASEVTVDVLLTNPGQNSEGVRHGVLRSSAENGRDAAGVARTHQPS